MHETVAQLEAAVERWHQQGWPAPLVHVVSGSGLAVDLPGEVLHRTTLDDAVPFAVHGIVGHPLEVQILRLASGRAVVYQKGRVHSYQGFDAHQTVFMVRLTALLGCRRLFMTNAAGALDPALRPGDLVFLRDHLNLMGLNPLRGELPAAWGPQFPDMGGAYDPGLREVARRAARRLRLRAGEGVYAGVAGPSYETPAEVRMMRTLGADVVGMSTVLEVIAARHMGVACLCLSLVSNLAAGVGGDGPLDHQEVLEAGREASRGVQRLLAALLESVDGDDAERAVDE